MMCEVSQNALRFRRIAGRVALALAILAVGAATPVLAAGCSSGDSSFSASQEPKRKPPEIDTYEKGSILDYLYVYDMGYADMVFPPGDVGLDGLLAALDSNAAFPDEYRGLVREYCEAVAEKYPGIELRPFRENLKTLTIVELSREQMSEKLGGEAYKGNYARSENAIYVLEGVDPAPGSFDRQILFHELSHCLRGCNLDDASGLLSDWNGWDVHFYFEGKSFYNGVTSEALNSLFAVSLLDEDADEIAYQLQSNYFSVMLECMDEYSLRDYVTHSSGYFAVKLNEYNGDDRAVDVLDLMQKQYDDFHSDDPDAYDPDEYLPVYDYLCDMYYGRNLSADMTYDEARELASGLINRVIHGTPVEYALRYGCFYDSLDDWCDRLGIERP